MDQTINTNKQNYHDIFNYCPHLIGNTSHRTPSKLLDSSVDTI